MVRASISPDAPKFQWNASEIQMAEKNGMASGSNLGLSEPEFYVNSIPGGEYELRIISLLGKDFYGYVTLKEEYF